MAEPTFEFDFRLAEADREGYYVTRWDRAEKITVTGSTKKGALQKAVAAVGEPRPGRYWVYECDGIREVAAEQEPQDSETP